MPLVFKIFEICLFVLGYRSRSKANALCPKTCQCFVAISSFARRMFRESRTPVRFPVIWPRFSGYIQRGKLLLILFQFAVFVVGLHQIRSECPCEA
ncbi:hypothetical protein DAI22_02g240100 [Oryza sativa Japonica Group]|nr:hypothetical protein DAI22_02g240100 [Oryza sativa Japonica Group]